MNVICPVKGWFEYQVALQNAVFITALNRRKVCFLMLGGLFFLMSLKVQAQSLHGDASQIFTDYKGYWASGVNAISKVKPDNSHNMLGFTWKGNTYSTGVNDTILTAAGLDFKPAEYQAFPIRNIGSTSSTYVAWGQLREGINKGIASSPPFPIPPVLANYLTDGLQGLDIGTGVANIKSGELVFNFTGIIDRHQIADGDPDILVSQIANPAGTTDEVYLADEKNKIVGNSVSVKYATNASVGTWTADFYHLNGRQATFTNEDRNLWLWGAELSAFGINESNYHLVKSMRYKLSGSSDLAFAAYKVGVFDIISANDDEAESKQGEVVEISVLHNDQPSTYLNPASVKIKSPPDNGTVSIDALTGLVFYTPDSTFYGIDTFVYEVCSNASEANLCDEALVGISVRSYTLPIKLIRFSAELTPTQQVKIDWTAAGETRDRDFEIERSFDGFHWEVIGTVPGAGSRTGYTFTDHYPLSGYNYYRLRREDTSGPIEISSVISVQVKKNTTEAIIIFPNPAADRVTIRGEAAALQQISIVNAYGQVQTQHFEVIRSHPSQLTLNLGRLPPGVYILRTATDGKIFRKR